MFPAIRSAENSHRKHGRKQRQGNMVQLTARLQVLLQHFLRSADLNDTSCPKNITRTPNLLGSFSKESKSRLDVEDCRRADISDELHVIYSFLLPQNCNSIAISFLFLLTLFSFFLFWQNSLVIF